MSGPSRTPAPTGCVYLGAPVFGKPPIWTQQSHCTITDRRVSAWGAGTAAGMGVQAIRCGTLLYRGWNRTREIQKPLVFGGVLFHISFAVERNMAAGGINAGRGCSPQSENAQRAVGDAGPYGVRPSGCAGKCGRGAGRKKRDQDRTRCAIGVGVVRAGDAIAREQNRNILLFHFFHSRKRFRRKALCLPKNGDF